MYSEGDVVFISQDERCQEMATRGHIIRFPAQGTVLFCRIVPLAADEIPRKETNAPASPDGTEFWDSGVGRPFRYHWVHPPCCSGEEVEVCPR